MWGAIGATGSDPRDARLEKTSPARKSRSNAVIAIAAT
jgi:hypothetical protein